MIVLEHGRYRVVRVEPETVDSVVALVEPMLRRSVAYTAGFETVAQMLEAMRGGLRPWQLWLVVSGAEVCGAFITALERCGPDTVCSFELLAGVEAAEWIAPLIWKFERYMAFMYGATVARIVGRKGWERFMAQWGYGASHFVTSKRLGPALEADRREFLPRGAVG